MNIARRKARLVIRGYEQQAGLDYFETFASVLKHATLRIITAEAAAKGWAIDYVNIDTAFLNPWLKEEIFMKLPRFIREVYPEIHIDTPAYIKLNKALYGLKQAPKEWINIVVAFFQKLGL